MRQMICAVAKFEYPPGKTWRKGQLFDVQDEHVKLFQIAGKAELPADDHAGAPLIAPAKTEVAPVVMAVAATKPKRKYKKRATKAEKEAAARKGAGTN